MSRENKNRTSERRKRTRLISVFFVADPIPSHHCSFSIPIWFNILKEIPVEHDSGRLKHSIYFNLQQHISEIIFRRRFDFQEKESELP